jgi:hypothetical protein
MYHLYAVVKEPDTQRTHRLEYGTFATYAKAKAAMEGAALIPHNDTPNGNMEHWHPVDIVMRWEILNIP